MYRIIHVLGHSSVNSKSVYIILWCCLFGSFVHPIVCWGIDEGSIGLETTDRTDMANIIIINNRTLVSILTSHIVIVIMCIVRTSKRNNSIFHYWFVPSPMLHFDANEHMPCVEHIYWIYLMLGAWISILYIAIQIGLPWDDCIRWQVIDSFATKIHVNQNPPGASMVPRWSIEIILIAYFSSVFCV